jgi:hypothetical protein
MYDDRFFEFIYVLEFIDDLIFYYRDRCLVFDCILCFSDRYPGSCLENRWKN